MNRGCKLCWGIVLVLAAVIVGAGYKFIVKGSTGSHADGRTVVLLLPDERNLVLAEMRVLLETVQAITEAATEGDLAAASEHATTMGMVAAGGVPAPTMAKLPLEFKSLGMATHQAFDELALSATVSEDPLEVLGELADLMNNCTGCHSIYRLGIEGEDKE